MEILQDKLVDIDGTGTLHGKWSGGKGDSTRRVGKCRRYRQYHGSGMDVLFCVAKKICERCPPVHHIAKSKIMIRTRERIRTWILGFTLYTPNQ